MHEIWYNINNNNLIDLNTVRKYVSYIYTYSEKIIVTRL